MATARRLAAISGALQPGRAPPACDVRPAPTMHSSNVRDEDFEVIVGGRVLDIPEFLPNISRRTRVGVVAPETGTEGAGAAALILAMITAFYDDLRAESSDFFAYPDFFVFQPRCPGAEPASYSMFDIWPDHKWVTVGGDRPIDWLRAITDRGVEVLLVPEQRGDPTPPTAADLRFNSIDENDDETDSYAKVALHSARRNISECWVYSPDGTTTDGDVCVRYHGEGARTTLPHVHEGDGFGGAVGGVGGGAAWASVRRS